MFILLNKNKDITDTYNMDESQKYAELKKWDIIEYILHFYIHIKF